MPKNPFLNFLRGTSFRLFVLAILAFAGCTEMRIEGDAKVFQASNTGTVIQSIIGIALMGLGVAGIVGSVLPDRKPKNRYARPDEKLSTGQRVGIAVFGASMGFVGLVLCVMAMLLPNKLHVTVHPDRVEMASTYSQANGNAIVVPFSNLSSVELRDEPNLVGKFRTYLVFTDKKGKLIKQEAGNNERHALETIQQALADYQKQHPAKADGETETVSSSTENTYQPTKPATPSATTSSIASSTPSPAASPTPSSNTPAIPSTTPPPKERPKPTVVLAPNTPNAPKRYVITIPVPIEYRIVPPSAILPVGTKLKACASGTWKVVSVDASHEDGTITCHWEESPTIKFKMVRQDLIQRGDSIDTMPESMAGTTNSETNVTNKGTTDFFGTEPSTTNSAPPPQPRKSAIASVAQASKPSTPSPSQYSLKRYVIDIPLPAGYQQVTPATMVRVGMKLQACYARHWEYVTVVGIEDDGTIVCNWDNWKAFTYKMLREDLIIANTDVP